MSAALGKGKVVEVPSLTLSLRLDRDEWAALLAFTGIDASPMTGAVTINLSIGNRPMKIEFTPPASVKP